MLLADLAKSDLLTVLIILGIIAALIFILKR
jgi:hypothetical protein